MNEQRNKEHAAGKDLSFLSFNMSLKKKCVYFMGPLIQGTFVQHLLTICYVVWTTWPGTEAGTEIMNDGCR